MEFAAELFAISIRIASRLPRGVLIVDPLPPPIGFEEVEEEEAAAVV